MGISTWSTAKSRSAHPFLLQAHLSYSLPISVNDNTILLVAQTLKPGSSPGSLFFLTLHTRLVIKSHWNYSEHTQNPTTSHHLHYYFLGDQAIIFPPDYCNGVLNNPAAALAPHSLTVIQ